MHAIKILKNKSVTISKPLKINNLTVPTTSAPAMYRMGLFCHRKYVLFFFCMQRARALFTYSRCIAVEFYDGFEFCVYSRAPAKINRKFAHLRWACDGPAKDFKTSDFSETSFLNPSKLATDFTICD